MDMWKALQDKCRERRARLDDREEEEKFKNAAMDLVRKLHHCVRL